MSEYRREMEQESFSPEEFVERLAWRTVTSGEFDPNNLHASFSEAISELKAISEIQRLKCVQVENSFMSEEQHLRSRLVMLLSRNETAADNLSNLEKKVNSVATKVVHLGDQLEAVHLPRERAAEAATLMRHLTDFLQPGAVLLSDVFRDKDRLFEAAEIIQKLQTIAQDLTGLPDSTKYDVAIQKITQKYDEIERSLIDEFARAQWANDLNRMKEIATILYNFKGYSQCINAFIEQSQLGGFKSKDIFDDVLPLCKLNKPIIDKVFRNPEHVMGKFMLHIFHGRIQETVAAQLYDRSNSDKINPKKFLKNLSHLYLQTKRVVRQLKDFDMGTDTQFLEQITEQIYRKHMENYISLETQCLQHENSRILQLYYESLGHQKRTLQSSFQDIRRDLQAVIGTRANINIAQIENFGGETFLSEEVAINLLQESRVAYSRCNLLSKKSEAPRNAAQILDILTHGLLREHVDYALELGLQGIPIPEAKSQPVIYFFDIVKRCNAIIHLYEKEFMESLLPLVEATPPVLSDCLERKKLVLEHIETKLDAGEDFYNDPLNLLGLGLLSDAYDTYVGIDRSLETIVGWVKVILQTEYSQKEFFRADSFSDIEKRNLISAACVKVIGFINAQVAKMRDSMDGKNIETVLTELGTRFHRVIYEHLLRFEYSSVGALNVTCDVGEYRKCIREFKSPLLNTLFDTLHALCNLLLILPSELNMYFNREELTCLDPAIRMNFVQLRSDFKTAKVHLSQSQAIRS